jgi:hypothetical protein
VAEGLMILIMGKDFVFIQIDGIKLGPVIAKDLFELKEGHLSIFIGIDCFEADVFFFFLCQRNGA